VKIPPERKIKMTVALNSEVGHGMLELDITGSATTHDLGNFLNPEGVTLFIEAAYIYITTAGLASCDLHVGVGAASTGVGQADLFADFGIDGTAGTLWKGAQLAVTQVAATTPALWHATDYLTFYTDTAYSTGFVGKIFVRYLRCTE
jgi:hypothetical protein